jgi:hypothetical protein
MNVEEIDALQAEADRLQQQAKLILPQLAEARRRYAVTKTDSDRTRFESIQDESSALRAKLGAIVDVMIAATGLPPELFQIVDELDAKADYSQIPRRNLRQDHIATTADLDSHLPQALDALRHLLPSGWVEEESPEVSRLDLSKPENILSLTKGLRPDSELPSIHRFRQAINVSHDYLSGHLAYDHFAGATLVPSLVQLGSQLNQLGQVGGDVQGRLERLWSGDSGNVDASLMELVTAARCAGLGRKVEFIPETRQKSPDLCCLTRFLS